MEFVKPFDVCEPVPTCTGYQFENVYVQRYDSTGKGFLEKVASKDIKAIINSSKDSCNYDSLIRKYQLTGDVGLLGGRPGVYADFTGMPTSLIEAYNVITDARRSFEALPIEERAKYDMNFEKFIADFGNDSFFEALGLLNSESEVVSDESVTE